MKKNIIIIFIRENSAVSDEKSSQLIKSGFTVISVFSGKDAEDAILSEKYHFTLTIIDIDAQAGIDIIPVIASRFSKEQIPVLFLYSDSGTKNIKITKKIPSYGYIYKEAPDSVFLASVKTALRIYNEAITLKNIKNQHYAMFEYASDPLLIIDPYDGTIINANIKVQQLIGRPKNKIISMHHTELYPEEHKKEIEKRFLLWNDGSSHTVNTQIQQVDGTRIPVELCSNTIKDPDGNKLIVFSIKDISNCIQWQHDLIQSRRDWEEIFNAIIHPICIITPDHTILDANKTACKIFGLTRETIKGTKCYALFHGTDSPPAMCPSEYALRSGKGELSEIEAENLHGHFLVSCTPITGESGTIEKIFHIATDITKQKTIQNALRESEEIFRELVTSSPSSIFVAQNGKYVFTNPAAAAFLGYSIEEIIGKNILDLIHPESHALVNERFTRETESGTNPPIEISALHKNGEKVFAESISVRIRFKSAPAMLILSRDISERKRHIEELKRTIGEKEILMMELQHRVKNNMQTIMSFLKLESSRITDKETISVFRQTEDRIRTMMLVYDKLYHTESDTTIDLSEYLGDLLLSLSTSYRMKEMNISLALDLTPIQIDSRRALAVGIIVNELITNSMKYAFIDNHHGSLHVNLADSEDCIILEVSDNGAGFPCSFSIDCSDGFGMRIVQSKAKELNGNIEWGTIAEGGAFVRLQFPHTTRH